MWRVEVSCHINLFEWSSPFKDYLDESDPMKKGEIESRTSYSIFWSLFSNLIPQAPLATCFLLPLVRRQNYYYGFPWESCTFLIVSVGKRLELRGRGGYCILPQVPPLDIHSKGMWVASMLMCLGTAGFWRPSN